MRSRPVPAVLIVLAALAAGACRAPEAVTFGIVSDCQFAAVPASGSRFYDRSWLKLREALDGFNARGVRFVVHLGDLIDRDAASYDLILPVFSHSRAPVRFVLGNHDYDIVSGRKAGLLERLGIGPGYYAFTEGDWRFVVLNGDELGVNFPKDENLARESAAMFAALEAAGRPNATKWNGGIGRAQIAFLERELAAADRKGLRAAVLCHFPVEPPAGHNLWNDEQVVALLERHPSVKAYFSGHNHDGGLAVRNGIAYLTFAGMVETAATSAAAVVILTEGRMVVDGTGREPDRTVILR
jgi:manganese-dependent ADP-ribose/CDP-alcohol diphosphatase